MAFGKDTKELIGDLQKRGWAIEKQGRQAHFRAYHPEGGAITIAGTPTCPRNYQNTMRDARRVEREHEMKKALPLRVFGGCFNGRERWIVAARTKADASRLFKIHYQDFHDYGGETEDPHEVKIAMQSPGAVYAANVRDSYRPQDRKYVLKREAP